MLNKILYKLKNNKLFAGIIISIFAVILFDLFVIIFDLIQVVKLSKNAVDYMNGFVALNVTGGILSLLAVGLVVFYIIFRRRKIKVQIDDKSKSR